MNRDQNLSGHSPLGAAMMAVSKEHFEKPAGHVPTVFQNSNADEHAVHIGIGGPGFTPKEVGGQHAL